jgi:hypothetical protein
MTVDARLTLWNQMILAAALARAGRDRMPDSHGEPASFCYTDTHAGSGRLPGPLPLLGRLDKRRKAFAVQSLFAALDQDPPEARHPGSWLLAARVLGQMGLWVEVDLNDIDPQIVTEARANREDGWVRTWTHDWFLFLRTRVAMTRKPDFVFIDPPPDDARGPAYAIDAAILLDALNVPYMVSYPALECQSCIDQIGRTGLELIWEDGAAGVLLGGGAEGVLMEILPDLRLMAEILEGEFVTRLPRGGDYAI